MSGHEPAPPGAVGTCADCHCAESPTPRRGFVKFLAGALSVVAGVIPGASGLLFFLDPLIRKGKSGGAASGGVVKDAEGFIKMAITKDALVNDGPPQKFTIFDDIINAWNKQPNQPIGAVWLRRINDQIIAFNVTCPHLGCAIEHRSTQGDFYCPCHTSAFGLDGKKLNLIPPRDMDALEVKVDGDAIWIKFQNFRGATSEKVVV